MKLYYFVVILCFSCASGNLVSNVRVVGFADYVIRVISATVKHLEQRSWCNLKVADASFPIDEVVLGWHANGTLHYKNGFVNSIQAVDIRQDTVQSVVSLNANTQAQAIVRGTLRMHDVAVGYDVEAELSDGNKRYTATYVYPLNSYAFTITKIIDTDDITVTVTGVVQGSTAFPQFSPVDMATDVFTTLFDRTMSVASMNAWGPDVIQHIAEEVITKEIDFPDICYNCALTV